MKKSIILVLFISACASSPNVIQPNQYSLQPDKKHAVLRFERESSLLAVGAIARLRINDEEVARLNSGDAYEHKVPIGVTKIAVDNPLDLATFTLTKPLKAKTVYHVTIAPRFSSLFMGGAMGVIGTGIDSSTSAEGGGNFGMTIKELE